MIVMGYGGYYGIYCWNSWIFFAGKVKRPMDYPQVVAVIGIFWLHDHVKRDD